MNETALRALFEAIRYRRTDPYRGVTVEEAAALELGRLGSLDAARASVASLVNPDAPAGFWGQVAGVLATARAARKAA